MLHSLLLLATIRVIVDVVADVADVVGVCIGVIVLLLRSELR